MSTPQTKKTTAILAVIFIAALVTKASKYFFESSSFSREGLIFIITAMIGFIIANRFYLAPPK